MYVCMYVVENMSKLVDDFYFCRRQWQRRYLAIKELAKLINRRHTFICSALFFNFMSFRRRYSRCGFQSVEYTSASTSWSNCNSQYTLSIFVDGHVSTMWFMDYCC